MPFRYESPVISRATLALGVIGLVCVLAITGLAWSHVPVPDALASVAGGAVGALATLLTTYVPSPMPGGTRGLDVPLPLPEVTNQNPSTPTG